MRRLPQVETTFLRHRQRPQQRIVTPWKLNSLVLSERTCPNPSAPVSFLHHPMVWRMEWLRSCSMHSLPTTFQKLQQRRTHLTESTAIPSPLGHILNRVYRIRMPLPVASRRILAIVRVVISRLSIYTLKSQKPLP